MLEIAFVCLRIEWREIDYCVEIPPPYFTLL